MDLREKKKKKRTSVGIISTKYNSRARSMSYDTNAEPFKRKKMSLRVLHFNPSEESQVASCEWQKKRTKGYSSSKAENNRNKITFGADQLSFGKQDPPNSSIASLICLTNSSENSDDSENFEKSQSATLRKKCKERSKSNHWWNYHKHVRPRWTGQKWVCRCASCAAWSGRGCPALSRAAAASADSGHSFVRSS